MANLYGWAGKILRADLTAGTTTDVPTSNYVPKFIGGGGICAKVAWDELTPDIGAFDAKNELIFMNGPVAGTLVPAAGRVHIGFISPATYPTEDYVKSNFGGHWGSELRFAGYDGIIVEGKATKPVWIWINDGKAEIKDASEYWGLDSYSVQQAIRNDLGSNRIQIATIGPAGENLMRHSVVLTDAGNAAGMGGAGAVMGSKKLKAIAVRGTGGVEVAKPDELAEYALWVKRQMYRPEARPAFGFDQIGVHRLGSGGSTDKARLDLFKKDTYQAGACFGCPIGCRTFFSVPDNIRPGVSNFCVANWYRSDDKKRHGENTSAYIKAMDILDALGPDVREIKRIIAWLKACYKEGSLTPEETGITFDDLGEYECAERLMKKVSYREGFGDKLAEGVCRASAALGKIGWESIDQINRGFEGGYRPRVWPTSALEAAMDNNHRKEMYHTWAARTIRKNPTFRSGTGWCTVEEWVAVLKEVFGREDVIDHIGDAYYAPNKGWLAQWTENYRTATVVGMELCDWAYPMWWSWYSEEPNRRGFSPQAEARMFSLVTGVDMDVDAMLKAGERIRNLERAIMVREGRRRDDDTLTDVFFTKASSKSHTSPGPDGVFVENVRTLDRDKFEGLKDAYYTERGWDLATGIPTRAKLEELDMKDVADELGV